MARDDLAFEKHCAICKKPICAVDKRWGYMRGNHYFCTYGHMREYDRQKEESRLGITLEQKKKAVQMLLDCEDVHTYLQEVCRCKNSGVTLRNIIAGLKKNDPVTFEKIRAAQLTRRPAVDKGMPKMKSLQLDAGADYEVGVKPPETELHVTVKDDEVVAAVISKPMNYDGFDIQAVKGLFGTYRFQEINGKRWIDYEDNESSNELSMTVEHWQEYLNELKRAARVLGVEL